MAFQCYGKNNSCHARLIYHNSRYRHLERVSDDFKHNPSNTPPPKAYCYSAPFPVDAVSVQLERLGARHNGKMGMERNESQRF